MSSAGQTIGEIAKGNAALMRYIDDLRKVTAFGHEHLIEAKCTAWRTARIIAAEDIDYIDIVLSTAGLDNPRMLETVARSMRDTELSYAIRRTFLRHMPHEILRIDRWERTASFYDRLVADKVPFDVVLHSHMVDGTETFYGEYCPEDRFSVMYLLDHGICPLAMMRLGAIDVPIDDDVASIAARCIMQLEGTAAQFIPRSWYTNDAVETAILQSGLCAFNYLQEERCWELISGGTIYQVRPGFRHWRDIKERHVDRPLPSIISYVSDLRHHPTGEYGTVCYRRYVAEHHLFFLQCLSYTLHRGSVTSEDAIDDTARKYVEVHGKFLLSKRKAVIEAVHICESLALTAYDTLSVARSSSVPPIVVPRMSFFVDRQRVRDLVNRASRYAKRIFMHRLVLPQSSYKNVAELTDMWRLYFEDDNDSVPDDIVMLPGWPWQTLFRCVFMRWYHRYFYVSLYDNKKRKRDSD